MGLINNHRNPLQDGRSYALSVSYERALSSRSGVGATLSGERQYLRDGGYSTTGRQVSLFGYREIGSMTLIGSLGFGRLEADKRLFLYPRTRADTLYRASLAATFRQLGLGQFAPLVRVTAERNRSSVEIFDYRRLRTEFALVRSF